MFLISLNVVDLFNAYYNLNFFY